MTPLAPSRRLTVGLMLGVGVYAMEGFSVATALPALTADLDAREHYASVITVYLLASVAGLVWAGARADRDGPARPLSYGLVALGIGLLVSTAAPDIWTLLGGRALQGFGGGVLGTVLYAIVQRVYPEAQRPTMLARLSLVWGGSAVAIPGMIGWLVDHVHWRSVFVVALPVVLACGWLVVPLCRGLAGSGDVRTRSLEERLAPLLLLGGATALLHPVPGWPPTAQWGVAAAGAVGCAWALRELWPPGTFSLRRGLAASIALRFLVSVSFFGAEVHLPLCLTEVHGRSSVFVGFTMALAAVLWSGSAFLPAAMLPRYRARTVATLGVLFTATGVCLMVPVANGVWPPLAVIVGYGLAAAGMGVAHTTGSHTAMADTEGTRAGDTGMALGIADAFGGAAGAGLASAFVVTGPGLGVSIQSAWICLAGVAATSLLAGWRVDVVGIARAAAAVTDADPDVDTAVADAAVLSNGSDVVLAATPGSRPVDPPG